MIQLTQKAADLCEKIRGKNYKGCGSGGEFCRICRNPPIQSREAINNWTTKINECAENYDKNKNHE